MVQFNGEYGVMGDLGMHVCHVGLRAGWVPVNVRAVLANIVTERPDGKGNTVACDTWDNATLLVAATDPRTGSEFPWAIRTHRIAPGELNTWYLAIYGTRACVRFSTKNPRRLEVLEYKGAEQAWQQLDLGYEPAFRAISGGIFEFGFGDALQQMLAAFFYELAHGRPLRPTAACATPEQAGMTHRIFTAALESQKRAAVVAV
jgi:predicted dehydrogenase